MRVAHALVDRAAPQPLDGEGAGPGARHRMVGGDVDGHAPVAQAMGADVGQPRVRRSEGRIARGAAALGEDDGGVGEQRERDDHRHDGRRAHAQRDGARVAAGLQERRAGGDDREQGEDRQPLRRGVPGIQGADGAKGRGGDPGERTGAQRDRHRAQLRAAAVEGDERGQPGEQARDRAAREAQVGAHPQRSGGGRGGDPQRARAGDVAGEPGAEDEADRRQRAGRVPVGHGLLQAPAGARGGVQVDDAGQQPPAQPVADDDQRAGREGGLDQARGAAVAPRQRPRRRAPAGTAAPARAPDRRPRGSTTSCRRSTSMPPTRRAPRERRALPARPESAGPGRRARPGRAAPTRRSRR